MNVGVSFVLPRAGEEAVRGRTSGAVAAPNKTRPRKLIRQLSFAAKVKKKGWRARH